MPRKISILIAALLLAAAVSCGRPAQNENQNQPATSQQPAAPAQAEQPPAQQPPQTAEPVQREAAAPAQSTSKRSANLGKAPSSPPSSPSSERPPAEPAPRPSNQAAEAQAGAGAAVTPPPQAQTRWVPSGTTLEVRLLDSLNSAVNKEGDTFQTSLEKDLSVDGRIVVPKGSTIIGKVLSVTQPGRVKGRAAMSIALTRLTVGTPLTPSRPTQCLLRPSRA